MSLLFVSNLCAVPLAAAQQSPHTDVVIKCGAKVPGGGEMPYEVCSINAPPLGKDLTWNVYSQGEVDQLMTAQNTAIQSQISALEGQIADLQNKYNALEAANDQFKADMTAQLDDEAILDNNNNFKLLEAKLLADFDQRYAKGSASE